MTPAGDPLAALRPLHMPPAVSWWPPAPGWWCLAGLLLVSAALIFYAVRRSRMRRAALRELTQLAGSGGRGHEFLVALAALLKRYALACYPDKGISALTGEQWLRFLDEHGGGGEFCSGCGRVLGGDLFQERVDFDPEELVELVRWWIRANRRRR